MRQLSRSVDVLTDKLAIANRHDGPFVDEELPGDHLAFAYHMSLKACRALVAQGIRKDWQVLPTRETVLWQTQLNAALVRLYEEEKGAFSVEQLFGMEPIWVGDAEAKEWRLELDTGLMEVVVECEGDEFEEKGERLRVGFALSERYGCVDVERG